MTFIRPRERFALSRVLFAVGGLFFAAEMGVMIYFYNRTVNLDAATLKAKAETQHIAAQNAILEQKSIAALGGLVRYKGPYNALIEETHPEYFNLNPRNSAKVISDAQR